MATAELSNANKLFYDKKYKDALVIFLKEKEFYSAGLCSLLLKDTKGARKYWGMKKGSCPASSFGLCVLDLISLKTDKLPSFFQTRAQLEVYISLFIENKLLEWAENLISCCDFLFQANPESYKFIGRALYANGYFQLAINFCKKSTKIFYADPEALLIISQCHYLLEDYGEALDVMNKVLDMVPDYFPAIMFEKIVRQKIEEKYQK